MNKQVSYAYQHLSRTETLGKCIHGSMYLCPALLIDSSGLNVPPVALSNVPGISESNVPPIAETNVPGVSL